MSSKLVVPADIFNLFETEKFSKLQTKRRDSSSSENSTKSEQNKDKTKEETEDTNESSHKNSLKFLTILTKTNTNNKLLDLKSEKSDISDKVESRDMNCSNKDNSGIKENVDESQLNGEPPTETSISSIMPGHGQVEISSLQTVAREGPAHLETKNNLNKSPVFLIKNANGKAVPLVFKNSILLKNSEIIDQKVFGPNNRTLIKVPNKLIANGNSLKSPSTKKLEISTPTLIAPPNSKTSEKSTQNSGIASEHRKEKLEKVSTEISPKISTPKFLDKFENDKSGVVSTKLVINRKLVPVSTATHVNISTSSTTSTTTSTFQEFIIKTSSGKQIIIPNKIKPQIKPQIKQLPVKIAPKVEILGKSAEEAPKIIAAENGNRLNPIKHNLLNKHTQSILINNQVVPINFNTKFTVESSSNTEQKKVDNKGDNSDAVLNIITQKIVDNLDLKTGDKTKGKPKKGDVLKKVDNQKKVDIPKTVDKPKTVEGTKGKQKKLQSPKNILRVPEKKLYQIQVEKEKGPKLIFAKEQTKNINNKAKDEVDLLRGCVQLPMYVENWTQTGTDRQDAACQTEIYVSPSPILDTVDEDCPNIPELIEFLLFNPKYSTGMDEETKTDIINNSLKFKPVEMAPIAPAPKPVLSLKERLFFDLRDCIGIDFLGNMPIHNAVLDNNVNDLKRQIFALRLRRFSVDVENNSDQSALQLAVINNRNQDIIAALLLNGASVSVKDSLGNTLLHLAVLNTSHNVLELILGYLSNKDATFINTKNDEGLTPLMVASIECKPESVGVLLKFGANPNLRDDKSGRTALFHAVELNNVPVINLLLQNKADPKIRNFFGSTAIDAVKDLNNPVANLIEKQATRTNPHALAEPTTSPKKRPNKRRPVTADKKPKMAVVSKKLKVDLGSLETQQQQEANVASSSNCSSSSEIKSPQMRMKMKMESSSPTRKKSKDK